ncbi:MAG: 30S ribosomal protein S20 [Sedimentisphaerales bacterium]|nr:30S ribosomal protein S20 [Sedimentisphaerales bacterium]
MAHSLSAKKRIRQNLKRRLRNRVHRGSVRTRIKKFQQLTREATDQEMLDKQYVLTQKKIDQLAAKGRIPKNTAARKKSLLARQRNAARVKTD